MKKTALLLAATAAFAFAPACDDGEDTITRATGDGDGDGGAGGSGGAEADYSCSEETTVLPEPSGLGGLGGGGQGGAPAFTCETPDAAKDSIEITGNFADQFGTNITVTDELWQLNDSNYALSYVNNAERYALARNGASNDFNPCLWSAFVWTETEDGMFFCQAAFNGESECSAADGVAQADPSDIESGCNGFGWSELKPN